MATITANPQAPASARPRTYLFVILGIIIGAAILFAGLMTSTTVRKTIFGADPAPAPPHDTARQAPGPDNAITTPPDRPAPVQAPIPQDSQELSTTPRK